MFIKLPNHLLPSKFLNGGEVNNKIALYYIHFNSVISNGKYLIFILLKLKLIIIIVFIIDVLLFYLKYKTFDLVWILVRDMIIYYRSSFNNVVIDINSAFLDFSE